MRSIKVHRKREGGGLVSIGNPEMEGERDTHRVSDM